MSDLNFWWQVRPVCSFPVLSLKRLSSCAAIVSLIVSTFFFRLFASASHLEMLLLSCVWGGIPHTKIAQHKLDSHLPCIHSWLRISWHLELTEYCLSLSAMNIFLMTWGKCLPSLWSCHWIVTTTHSQTSNDPTSDSELQSSGSEDPDDSYKVLFLPDTDVECVTVQVKDSGIFTIFIGGG